MTRCKGLGRSRLIRENIPLQLNFGTTLLFLHWLCYLILLQTGRAGFPQKYPCSRGRTAVLVPNPGKLQPVICKVAFCHETHVKWVNPGPFGVHTPTNSGFCRDLTPKGRCRLFMQRARRPLVVLAGHRIENPSSVPRSMTNKCAEDRDVNQLLLI